MSFALIVERRGSAAPIRLDEWRSWVAASEQLQLRTEPRVGVIPTSGKRFVLPLGPADADILVDGQWEPFLRFDDGALVIEYDEDYEDPDHPIRMAIVQVARALRAVIGNDMDEEEVFDWE